MRARFSVVSAWFRHTMVLGALLGGTTALAQSYPIRCNREQSTCEVDTKRLTRGDKVGIFNDDGQIIAVGTVVSLRDRFRIVHINKRYGTILRDHRLQMIKDSEAENPLKYFGTVKGEAARHIGASLGFTSIGVADGFTGVDFEVVGEFRWALHSYYFAKFLYLSGSGKGSKTELEVTDATIKVSAYGILGGASFIFWPTNIVSMRSEIGLGLASVKLSTDSTADEQKLVESRVSSGTGLLFRVEADAVYQMGAFKPYAGVNYLRLQNSNNYGVSFGGLYEF